MVALLNDSPLALSLKNFDEIVNIDGHDIDSAAALLVALNNLKPGSKILVNRKIPHQAALEKITVEAPSKLTMAQPEKPITIVHNQVDNNLSTETKQQISTTQEILKKELDLAFLHHGIVPAKGVIAATKGGSVIEHLGFSVGDRIVSLDGETMATLPLPQAILQNPFATHVMGVIKADGTPVVAVFSLPQKVTDHLGLDADLLSVVGFSVAEVFKPGELIERRVSVFEALRRASAQTADIAYMTGKSLVMLVRNEAPTSQIGGPIMLFDIAQKAAQKGLAYYIFIMCLLSVNLGLLNLLPIPALDGGHLLLLALRLCKESP